MKRVRLDSRLRGNDGGSWVLKEMGRALEGVHR